MMINKVIRLGSTGVGIGLYIQSWVSGSVQSANGINKGSGAWVRR